MSNRIAFPIRGCAFALALLGAPAVLAESPSVTPVMQRAFAKLEQGPDELRWYVYRTRMVYFLRSSDVVAAYVAANHGEPAKLALAAAVTNSMAGEDR